MTVDGPSLISSTAMVVPNRPVATVAPSARSSSTTRVTSGSVGFADEIVDKGEIEGAETKAAVNDRELAAAGQLIESLASPWKPEKYEDTYREQIEDLIKREAKGEELVVPERTKDEPKVLDLMAALETSIAARGSRKPAAKKSARKKASPARKQARKSA